MAEQEAKVIKELAAHPVQKAKEIVPVGVVGAAAGLVVGAAAGVVGVVKGKISGSQEGTRPSSENGGTSTSSTSGSKTPAAKTTTHDVEATTTSSRKTTRSAVGMGVPGIIIGRFWDPPETQVSWPTPALGKPQK